MPIRSFRVPDTRLPFVNGQIAQVNFEGEPHLVSAVWAGEDPGGRIYFWNPLTGSHDNRKLPNSIPGAYMLATAIDGRLYIGCGNGDLVRYDPTKDDFEVLVHGQMHSITWGGCVTDRYAVWTASPGDACVYDIRESKLVKKFAPVDTSEPHAHYGHNAVAAPDGNAILTMNVPQARLVVIDLKEMTATSHTPHVLRGHSWTGNAQFVDGQTLLLVLGTESARVVLLKYPGFDLVGTIELPQGLMPTSRKGALVDGKFYGIFDTPTPGSLHRLDVASRKWELVLDGWLGEDTAYLGVFQDRYVCGITVRGRAVTFDPRSGKPLKDVDVQNVGQLDPHCFCGVPENELIIGAPFINSSFWTIDTETGEGKDQGRGMPGAGQINQILWDAGRHRAYFAAYTAAAVCEFDPTQPTEWPKNPHVIASAKQEHQMRPRALAFDRRFVWMATSADYGQLGGALSRVDPESREIKVWRNIISDQTITSIVLDLQKHRVYLASSIAADSESAPPTQTTAQVAAFDMATLKVLRSQTVRDGAANLSVVCLLPDGRVLVREENRYYAWDTDGGAVRALGELAGINAVATADDGTNWAATSNGIGRITVADEKVQFTPVLNRPAGSIEVVREKMYWAWGKEIFEAPIADL